MHPPTTTAAQKAAAPDLTMAHVSLPDHCAYKCVEGGIIGCGVFSGVAVSARVNRYHACVDRQQR